MFELEELKQKSLAVKLGILPVYGEEDVKFSQETRRKVLNHFSSLLESIEVEVVTTPADPVTITADTGA